MCQPTVSGWEIATAIGTVGATLAAVGIASKDEIIRRLERLANGKLVAILLWPRLRRLLNAVALLQEHEVTWTVDLPSDRIDSLKQLLHDLDSADIAQLDYLNQLPARIAIRLANAISNVDHARRHARQLADRGRSIGQSAVVAKQKAVKKSAADARAELAWLVAYSRSEMGHDPADDPA